MKISARNQLSGRVVSVDEGGVMATVEIELDGGQQVAAVITKESVRTLNLQPGDQVLAVIKATEVMVGKE